MGTSLIKYDGMGIWTHDGTIQIWLALMIQEIDAESKMSEWTQLLREEWCYSATCAGMGCANINFNKYALTTNRLNWLINLCEKALLRLTSFGEWIPKDVLNTLVRPDGLGLYTDDMPVNAVRSLGNNIIKLLSSSLTLDPNDPRWIVKINE
jgi:hypothetical protein